MLMQLLQVQEYFENVYSDQQYNAVIIGPVREAMTNSNFPHRRFDGDLGYTSKLDDVARFDCLVLPNRRVAERFCEFMVSCYHLVNLSSSL